MNEKLVVNQKNEMKWNKSVEKKERGKKLWKLIRFYLWVLCGFFGVKKKNNE